jgi:hypothetical protein
MEKWYYGNLEKYAEIWEWTDFVTVQKEGKLDEANTRTSQLSIIVTSFKLHFHHFCMKISVIKTSKKTKNVLIW